MYTLSAFAMTDSGIGAMAGSMMEPLSILTDFVFSAAIIIGSSFLFAGLIKYKQHRDNPYFVPISTVVVLFVMGLILVFLPLTYRLVNQNIPQLNTHFAK